jgi:hypothetical protein
MRMRRARTAIGLFLAAAFLLGPLPAVAGTTGTITGVVSDAATGAPIANVRVTAASPSQTQTTTTNAAGFYSLQALTPDTYSVSFQAQGYDAASQPGITVQQDLQSKVDFKLTKSLKTIAKITARSAGNLVQPYTGTDVYNVSGAQLNAATGGDNLHRTIYDYMATVPGVTPIGGGFPAEPSIRGGYDVDNGYELDGVPITERVTGYFTTNLTDLGISNVEVYTGGLGANNAGNGLGVINSVIKTGTYPGFGMVSAGASGPDYGHFLRAEYGGATQNRRYSWYLAFDGANTRNTFWSGSQNINIPIDVLGINSGNPGHVTTKDFIGNFHYRPDAKNDFQFFYQNSLMDDVADYNLQFGTKNAPYLRILPCPGAVPDPNSKNTNATGGIAPNGQPCPVGYYWVALANGTGNQMGHYSGIGKIQWNHIIDDHSSLAIRLAENFNEYIWNQPFEDPNQPGEDLGTGCPPTPYTPGSPVPASASNRPCNEDLGGYYQDRRAEQYYASLDYTSTPTANVTYKAGVGQEFDNSYRLVGYPNKMNFPGSVGSTHSCYGTSFTWPCINALTDIPTHVPYVYGQASFNLGRWTLQPGLRWTAMFYGFPDTTGGGHQMDFIAPSLLGTYRMGANDAFRFSYATTGQFIGNEFVYRFNSPTYNPLSNGEQAYTPYINHVTDFQWEHQFGPHTSLKFGPYYRAANNYFGSYTPFIGFEPGTNIPKYGDTELVDNVHIRALGFELGLSHVDPRDTGASFWLSGSYNNYWTQVSNVTGGQVSFLSYPLPGNFTSQGLYVRGYQTPLLTSTLTADLHSHGWHLMPVVYYAFDTFYNTGGCIDTTIDPHDGPPVNDCVSALDDMGTQVLAPEQVGGGYFFVNTTIMKELTHNLALGVRISNVTNQQKWTTPCYNAQDPNLPDGFGSGCYGQNGAGSGFKAPIGWVYQPITQTPRTIEGFMTIHF